jgi:hypothetical protein
MEEIKQLVRNKLSRQISSFKVDKENVLKLLQILQERSYAAYELEIARFKRLENESDESYEQSKETLKNGFELKITINSIDDQEFYGSISDIFESPNFPDEIKTVYVKSDIPLNVSYKYYPRNSFELQLDFTKPHFLNLSFLPSQATPNLSHITVQGFDTTWVHGVFNEVNNFVDKHPSQGTWIHKHSVYDLLVWTLGLPIGFWIVFKCSAFINKIFGPISIFVQSAAYVYSFLGTLVLFRLLFHYIRWIWPLIEYKSKDSKVGKHRFVLITIILGCITAFVYDVAKLFIS